MKYDFDHWDKTEMTQEEALDWFESELEFADGKRCFPTCPQCQANEWAIKALSVRWHPYPKEKPSEQGFYLITEPVMLNSKEYRVQIYYWGKSWECEEIDPKLKKKKAYWIYSDSEWGDYECKDVVAWMPLPGPYVPKEKPNETN